MEWPQATPEHKEPGPLGSSVPWNVIMDDGSEEKLDQFQFFGGITAMQILPQL